LNAIAHPAAREPGLLVTFVRCRTVAKVDSIGLIVCRWTRTMSRPGTWCGSGDPVLGRIVVGRDQLLDIVGDLRDRLEERRVVVASNAVTAAGACRRSSAFPDLG
jgi:hypothetical protein